jgi:hypothetical protein
MAARPRAMITTPYPSAAVTARVLGVSAKRYQELRAMVTEYLERQRSARGPGRMQHARRRQTAAVRARAAERAAAR